MTETLPDLLRPGLDLVFVGINPANRSARVGHYYKHLRNEFWRWLSASPLVDRELGPEDDHDLPERYGIGLTDVVKRVETDSTKVCRDEQEKARSEFQQRIVDAAPRVVCFNGAVAFKAVFGQKAWRSRSWGRQNVHLAGAEVWVMPSSSGTASGAHKYAPGVLEELATALSRTRRSDASED